MSTKQCRGCGNTNLVLIRTQSLKMCSDCGRTIAWPLSEGQKPVPEGARARPMSNEKGIQS